MELKRPVLHPLAEGTPLLTMLQARVFARRVWWMMAGMDQVQDRALIREWTPGFYASWGVGLSIVLAAVGGFLFDTLHNDDRALYAALEAVLIFGWVGAPIGGLVGILVELSRPAQQRRMLEKRIVLSEGSQPRSNAGV